MSQEQLYCMLLWVAGCAVEVPEVIKDDDGERPTTEEEKVEFCLMKYRALKDLRDSWQPLVDQDE